MIFPLAEGDKSEVGEMVGGKQIQEEIARALPIIGPPKNLKGINETPSIGVKL
jgi:hypothetical protein